MKGSKKTLGSKLLYFFRTPPEKRPTPYNSIYDRDFLKIPHIFPNEEIGLLIIVKSAEGNIKNRNIIRKTWGSKDYLQRNQISESAITQLYFICGRNSSNPILLREESDLIIGDFMDTYKNLTYKSMMAFKFAVQLNFRYLLLVDDDM